MENLLRLGTENPAVARRKIEQNLRQEMQAGNLAPEAEALFQEGWRADGTAYAWELGGTEVRISIQDESGKIATRLDEKSDRAGESPENR